MILDITACLLLFVITGAGATNISSSDCSVVLSEDLFVIWIRLVQYKLLVYILGNLPRIAI